MVMKTIEMLTGDMAPAFGSLVRNRRATPHFRPDPVPAEVIDIALALAAEAPSGFNSQPWRFLVLRDAGRRAALRQAAFDQAKITEAPVVIIAFAQREGWKSHFEGILREKARRTGQDEKNAGAQKKQALDFIARLPAAVWLNRHVMIAFAYLMLAFEAQGWDTAPMEGFDAEAVRRTFSLPDDAEAIALLAVGRASAPETPHPGRLPVEQIAFAERVDEPWKPSA